MITGCAGRALDVDLATQTFTIGPLGEETARLCFGGQGCDARPLTRLQVRL